MRRRTPRALALFAVLALLLCACARTETALPEPSSDPPPHAAGEESVVALFLGVKDYGHTETVKKENAASFLYRFLVGDAERLYTVPVSPDYALQTRLREGTFYRLTAQNGVVSGLEEVSPEDEAFLSGKITDLTEKSVVIGHTEAALPEVVLSFKGAPGGVEVRKASPKTGENALLLPAEGERDAVLYLPPKSVAYRPPVKGTPGERTVKNLLKTALSPVGVCLYVFGGGWDWQDEAAGPQSRSLGVQKSWTDFFFSVDENYTYRDPEGDESRRDKTKSYCPFGEFNEYYYAGLDCAGYLGWTAYNVMHTVSGEEGYVFGGTATAQSFSALGWGTFTQDFKKEDLKPGDVVSINGHVWMLVGRCEDGSLVIAHASPTRSVTENPGGGVQLSALGESESCRAWTLLNEYVNLFYPDWAARYRVRLIDYAYYTSFTGDVAGLFSWNVPETLSDPEGVRDMSAEEILSLLFDYAPVAPAAEETEAPAQ